ncbi:hypothetical protein ACFL1G_10400 [Planctomycetota bacterium]
MSKSETWTGIWLKRRLILSEAFRALKTSSSHVVLMIFMSKRDMQEAGLGKRKEWIIQNNGEITFTYKEAEQKYGISNSRFTKALDELIDKGFIDIAAPGVGVYKLSTLYSISERWKDYGTPDFVKKERKKGTINRGFQIGNRYGRNCR